MNGSIKKIINFRFDRYEDMELKLEKLAAKGLFLEDCGPYLWTFKKGAPKNLAYTVTFFPEGSVFNPGITDNQQTYFDYAKAAGYHFVTAFNQMQIFWSEPDNPIPFETDPAEKLKNIKRCMNKSFLPSTIVLLVVLLFNLIVQFNSFRMDPIEFLSNLNQLVSGLMFLAFVIYQLYILISYLSWIHRSEKSIATGGDLVKNGGRAARVVNLIFAALIITTTSYLLLSLAFQISWFAILLIVVQAPLQMVIFSSSINYLKSKKASALKNKVVSVALLFLVNFSYFGLILNLVVDHGMNPVHRTPVRTVQWTLNDANTHEYTLYRDDIPLTYEDLYGQVDYDYYSYQRESDQTYFLSKTEYRQDSLPAIDSPPEIHYEILEPKFDFVYDLVQNHLREVPTWRDSVTNEPIDNQIFNTTLAYQSHYDGTPTGEYLLLFEKKIVVLTLTEPLNLDQIQIVKEKLNL